MVINLKFAPCFYSVNNGRALAVLEVVSVYIFLTLLPRHYSHGRNGTKSPAERDQ